MSVRPSPPRQSRTGVIGLHSALGGYAVAWVAGQVLFAVVMAIADAAGAIDLNDDDSIPVPLLFAGAAVGWAIYLTMMWWLSQREGTADPVADYGVRFEWRDLVGLPIGAATQLVALPALYWPLNELWPETFNEDALAENAKDLVDRANGVGVALLIVMVVAGAPLVEELVYRGLLQGALVRRVGGWLGVLAAATVFALIHFRPVEYPGLFIAGLVFGGCALVSGRLGPAIAAHVGFNAVGLLLAAG